MKMRTEVTRTDKKGARRSTLNPLVFTSPANKNQAGNQKIFQAKRAQQSRDSKIRVSEFSEEGCYAASGLAAKYAARCSSGVMSTKGRSSRRTA